MGKNQHRCPPRFLATSLDRKPTNPRALSVPKGAAKTGWGRESIELYGISQARLHDCEMPINICMVATAALVPPLPALRPALVARAAAPVALMEPSLLMEPTLLEGVGQTVAFADQAGNLAGVLFPASLPPYLLFLYFVNQEVNGLSATAKAGFTSLLAFVIATVVTSIVSVKTFGLNLANVDWLHSGAEQRARRTHI
jgi:hypothetical protein